MIKPRTTAQVLRFISDYQRANGTSPSIREIVTFADYASTSAALYLLDVLEKFGYIERRPKIARAIRLTSKARRLISEKEIEG